MQLIITTVIAAVLAVGGTVATVNVVGGADDAAGGDTATVYTDQ